MIFMQNNIGFALGLWFSFYLSEMRAAAFLRFFFSPFLLFSLFPFQHGLFAQLIQLRPKRERELS